MKNLFVFLNPVAGNSEPDVLRELLQRRCAEPGCTYGLHETREDERLADVVHEALGRGFDVVAAAGGDGTVSA